MKTFSSFIFQPFEYTYKRVVNGFVLVLVIALRPPTAEHIRGGWLHYTDTSEPVDGNGAQNIVTVLSGFEPVTFRSLAHELSNRAHMVLYCIVLYYIVLYCIVLLRLLSPPLPKPSLCTFCSCSLSDEM
jgi:hypothetical protein